MESRRLCLYGLDPRKGIQYCICMKMITINVDDHVYDRIKTHAERSRTSASELIRTAMAEYAGTHVPHHTSIFDSEPVSVGRILHDLSAEDDMLDEMLS